MFNVNRIKSDGDQKVNRNLNMIKLFYQNKDYATAKNYVAELLSLKPDSSEAYKLLSQINEALGEHEQAMKNYQKSLDLKVYSDQNNSLDNSYQFTPTKISSPVVNNKSNNHACNQENIFNQDSFGNIEKLFEKKIAIFEKSVEGINQHLAQLNNNFNKNYEEVSSFKKKLLDMQKKLTLFENKQDELFNKLPSLTPKNDEMFKEQLNSFSINLSNLSEDNCKILDELYNIKETIKVLCDRSNASDYDENESYNDYENEEEEQTPPLVGPQPKLNELFKPSKDNWNCSVCDTKNLLSEHHCACCENPNPNSNISKPEINDFAINTNGGSVFKFGVSSPSFGFGAQTSQSSAFPPFTNNVNSSSSLLNSVQTSASNSFSFGNTPNSNFASFNQKTSAPAFSSTNVPSFPSFGSINTSSSSIAKATVASTTTTLTFPSFGVSSNSSSSFVTSTNSPSTTTKATTTFSFNGQLNSLGSVSPQSSLSFKPSLNGLSNTLANSTSVATTDFSSFSSSLKTTTTNSNVSAATTTTNSGFSFNTSSNSNSIFSIKPKSDFSFKNVTFSSNLFGQQPSLTNNSMSKNEEADEKEENHLESAADNAQDGDYFKLPDVKLPEKYEQVTGEEEESVIFEKKSKLFIFKDGEYKERGVGTLKILKHNTTLKYRVLMRRELIFKVCLNAYLSDMTNLEIVEQKFVRFSCIDFSEDKPSSGVFLVKFGKPEALSEFKALVETLRDKKDQNTLVTENKQCKNETINGGDCEVELVYTKQPKPEHLKEISSLHLPVNFYDYEDKAPCKGCIGCKDEDIKWNELTRSTSDNVDSSKPDDLGLFSLIATDLNLAQNKVDSIVAANECLENEHTNDQNFVSEKSKLLPQNFELKTGEEDEDVLFNERSKMYHYVSGEWKERGVGNMKILKRKDSNNYRLLMRRERILNVICNHKISEHVKLDPFQNSNNTLTWFSKDYSEESSGIDEVFALKFKNEALMKQFENKVKECIEKLSV